MDASLRWHDKVRKESQAETPCAEEQGALNYLTLKSGGGGLLLRDFLGKGGGRAVAYTRALGPVSLGGAVRLHMVRAVLSRMVRKLGGFEGCFGCLIGRHLIGRHD